MSVLRLDLNDEIAKGILFSLDTLASRQWRDGERAVEAKSRDRAAYFQTEYHRTMDLRNELQNAVVKVEAKNRSETSDDIYEEVMRGIDLLEGIVKVAWPSMAKEQRKNVDKNLVTLASEVEQVLEGCLDAMPEERREFWQVALAVRGA